jgi:hypothetical protein
VPVAALVALLAAAAAAHSTPAASAIVCPQARGVIIPCCGPPVDSERTGDCCPNATIECGPRLTITAAPDPMAAGRKVVVWGQLIAASPSGDTISLWQKLPAAQGFQRVRQATTGSSGGYSFTFPAGRINTNRSWYVAGDGLTSITVSEQVLAHVTLRLTRTRHSATLSGRVTPAAALRHASREILLGRLVDHRWSVLVRAPLNGRRRFVVSYPYRPRVRATVRATLPGNLWVAQSVSRALTGVIFPRVTAK